MKIHAIVDYSYLYYKYFFQLQSGKMRRLTAPVEWKGAVMEKDISQIYYSIREIEGFRRQLEGVGHDVTVSICFDMPSMRSKETDENGDKTEGAEQYKATRVSRLNQDDYDNIAYVSELLKEAGYNVYKEIGYEADDIVNHLVETEQDNFDYSVIYTPDSDLLVNIGPKVGASRYKSRSGYTNVDINNYSDYLATEFKVVKFPYNCIMLFKSTVGDKSDNITGIQRFGPKAFDKLIVYLEDRGINWEDSATYEGTLDILDKCEGYLKEDQIEQAKESLSLVRSMKFEEGIIDRPTSKSTAELREQSYMKCGMKSLII